MPFRLGPAEIALVLFVVLIVFGVGRLPKIGSAIGKGIYEFRKAQREDTDEEKVKKRVKRRVSKTSAGQGGHARENAR
jgi:sec-independent protein translocase protein TatA